mmetsp:Transcript_3816/g.9445  ORF Transcript_3816/g.9445 Transcript_3816/m.9445 type:complete len:96 (+) Transcript_3816:154-441(+)
MSQDLSSPKANKFCSVLCTFHRQVANGTSDGRQYFRYLRGGKKMHKDRKSSSFPCFLLICLVICADVADCTGRQALYGEIRRSQHLNQWENGSML